ncbi:MAG TPA: TetR/AcrR family transcriptional regulator [Rhodoglobus sp.]|nr:TetR/AcrR family transcriptional regulator [Rhodoglobus sp.]
MVARKPRVAEPLALDRIVEQAIAVADRDGLGGLSMRRLGGELGADPMSIYHHVPGKDALLAAMVDRVVAGIRPAAEGEWADALRATVLGARAVMLRHPWAARALEGRADPTPATIAYLDAVMGILRRGGLSLELVHHAIHLLGSRVLGFSQDLFDDSTDQDPSPEQRAAQAEAWASALPYVAELALAATHDGGLGGCDDDEEFAFALDVIIEGLARRASA